MCTYVLDEVCVSLSDEVSLSLSDSLLSVPSRVFFLLFLMCFKETIAKAACNLIGMQLAYTGYTAHHNTDQS